MLGVGGDFADGDLFGTDQDKADVVGGPEEDLLGRGDLAFGELFADDEEEAEGVVSAGGHGKLTFAAAVAGDAGAGGVGVGGCLLRFAGPVGGFFDEVDGTEVAVDGAVEHVLDLKAGDGGFQFEGELPLVAIFGRQELTVSEAEATGPTDLIAGGFVVRPSGPEPGRQKDEPPATHVVQPTMRSAFVARRRLGRCRGFGGRSASRCSGRRFDGRGVPYGGGNRVQEGDRAWR